MVSLLKTKSANNLNNRINSLCCEIEVLASDSGENKKGNLFMDCLFGSHVGMTR
jgi:hypothetical protein